MTRTTVKTLRHGHKHLLACVYILLARICWADDASHDSRRVLVCGDRTAIVEITSGLANGSPHSQETVEWSYPASSREGWVLPNGNLLLALSKGNLTPHGAAVEIKRQEQSEDAIVWRYDGVQDEVNSIHKTPQGTYVLTEAGPHPRLLEIDSDGNVQIEFPLVCQKPNSHMQTRMARKQLDGTYLVPHLLDFAIIRYNAAGKEVSRIDTHVPGEPAINSWPFTAITLPDGGILAGLTNGNRVVEFDKDGTLRWQITAADTDGLIDDACGVQRLPNGNTMIASYHIGKGGVRLLEVTPEKKVVWAWKANVPAVHHFHLLSMNGATIAPPPLR